MRKMYASIRYIEILVRCSCLSGLYINQTYNLKLTWDKETSYEFKIPNELMTKNIKEKYQKKKKKKQDSNTCWKHSIRYCSHFESIL